MRLAAPVLLSALLGCGGSLEPGDVAGSYRLTTVDAAALPYLVYATIECDVRITGGLLTLTSNGGFALRYETEMDCGAASVASRTREDAGVFSLDGRRIHLNGASSEGLRINYEGHAHGAGFLIVTSDHLENPTRELELGFEPAVERLVE